MLKNIEFTDQLPVTTAAIPVISINADHVDRKVSQPGTYAVISESGTITAILKIYQTAHDYFLYNRFVIWQSWIVIGCGGYVHFIASDHKTIKSLKFGDSIFAYFQELITAREYTEQLGFGKLLVTAGTSLTLFNEYAEIIWQQDHFAVDGTTVSNIHDDVIYGSAELDPLGGWVDFELSAV